MNELLTKGICHTGFKDSPVGKIPVEWEVKELVQVGRCIRGLTYSPDNVVENGLLVLRSSNVQDGRLLFEDNVYVDLKVGDEYLSKNGDILICVRNGSRRLLGKSATITSNCPKSTHGAFMTVFRGELNFYVKHLMKSEMFFRQVSIDIGATINSINNSNLLQFRFSFPSLPEQQKIASILTSVDEVIEKTQSQINKLQDLKKGTMNELLTKGIGHTEFKDSPVGKIPVGWDIVELGSLCGFTQGVQIPLSDTLRKETDGYIRYLYINDFSSDKKLRFVRNEYSEKIVTTKDLVMANTGHTAGSVFRGKHGVLSNNAFKISVNEKIIPEYLYYYLTTDDYWIQIGRLFNSAGQPHVGHGNIAKLNFLCPSIYEQSEVVNILFSIEQNIEEKQRKLEQTQSLKKSLMQDLLTGKVRVTVH